MYFRDHAPPHFHVRYGEYKAKVNIKTGDVEGYLSKTAKRLVQKWRKAHIDDLLRAWAQAEAEDEIQRIPPLE